MKTRSLCRLCRQWNTVDTLEAQQRSRRHDFGQIRLPCDETTPNFWSQISFVLWHSIQNWWLKSEQQYWWQHSCEATKAYLLVDLANKALSSITGNFRISWVKYRVPWTTCAVKSLKQQLLSCDQWLAKQNNFYSAPTCTGSMADAGENGYVQCAQAMTGMAHSPWGCLQDCINRKVESCLFECCKCLLFVL